MSDFLASLVGSQLQPNAGLRPRPVSRFEPVAAPHELTELHVESEARDRPAQQKPVAHARALSTAPGEAHETTAEPAAITGRKLEPATSGSAARLAAAIADGDGAGRLIAERARDSMPRAPETTRVAVREIHRVVERPARGARMEPARPDRKPTREPATGTPAPPPVPHGRVEGALVPPAGEVRNTSPRETPAPAPIVGPTVHVTIGRIEVRDGRRGPDPARPAPKPTGIMSLEEYVERRGRSGG